MYLKVICFILLTSFLISCAPSRTGDVGTPKDKGSTCWTKGYAMNTLYEIKHISEKKYKAYGQCMGLFSIDHENVKECTLEESKKSCQKNHGTRLINKKWSTEKRDLECDLIILDFECDITKSEKKKIEKTNINNEKTNIEELENIYQEACISSYNKLKKSNQKKYSLKSPLYHKYRGCLIGENEKIRKQTTSIARNIKALDNRALAATSWTSNKCQNETKYISSKSFKVYNKLYLECSNNIYELAKKKHQSIIENDNKKIIKQFPESKKYCETEWVTLIGQSRCFKNIVREEKSIASLEDHFWWLDWQCAVKNIYYQDRYRVYHNCLKSLKIQEEEDNAKERAKKAKEKKERQKAERELAELEPYKKKCESFGFKRKSTEISMCIMRIQELEIQQIEYEKQIAEAKKETAILYQLIEELRATNTSILEEQKRQNYLAQLQSQTLRKTQAIQQRQLNISQFQESMRLMGLGLGMMTTNQPIRIKCSPYLLDSVSCTY